MKTRILVLLSLIASPWIASAAEGPDPHAMDALIIECKSALELNQASEKPIPALVLEQCKGLAIAKVTRGGIVIGASSGQGILIAKTEDGWSAPSAFDTGGGSFGAQIGLDTIRYIFVLNTPTAIQQFTGKKVSLDAQASATAGPDHSAAANRELPKADIYIYALSDGAFAGATVGGMYVNVDKDLNDEVYSNLVTTMEIITGEVSPPATAESLYELLP